MNPLRRASQLIEQIAVEEIDEPRRVITDAEDITKEHSHGQEGRRGRPEVEGRRAQTGPRAEEGRQAARPRRDPGVRGEDRQLEPRGRVHAPLLEVALPQPHGVAGDRDDVPGSAPAARLRHHQRAGRSCHQCELTALQYPAGALTRKTPVAVDDPGLHAPERTTEPPAVAARRTGQPHRLHDVRDDQPGVFRVPFTPPLFVDLTQGRFAGSLRERVALQPAGTWPVVPHAGPVPSQGGKHRKAQSPRKPRKPLPLWGRQAVNGALTFAAVVLAVGALVLLTACTPSPRYRPELAAAATATTPAAHAAVGAIHLYETSNYGGYRWYRETANLGSTCHRVTGPGNLAYSAANRSSHYIRVHWQDDCGTAGDDSYLIPPWTDVPVFRPGGPGTPAIGVKSIRRAG